MSRPSAVLYFCEYRWRFMKLRNPIFFFVAAWLLACPSVFALTAQEAMDMVAQQVKDGELQIGLRGF